MTLRQPLNCDGCQRALPKRHIAASFVNAASSDTPAGRYCSRECVPQYVSVPYSDSRIGTLVSEHAHLFAATADANRRLVPLLLVRAMREYASTTTTLQHVGLKPDEVKKHASGGAEPPAKKGGGDGGGGDAVAASSDEPEIKVPLVWVLPADTVAQFNDSTPQQAAVKAAAEAVMVNVLPQLRKFKEAIYPPHAVRQLMLRLFNEGLLGASAKITLKQLATCYRVVVEHSDSFSLRIRGRDFVGGSAYHESHTAEGDASFVTAVSQRLASDEQRVQWLRALYQESQNTQWSHHVFTNVAPLFIEFGHKFDTRPTLNQLFAMATLVMDALSHVWPTLSWQVSSVPQLADWFAYVGRTVYALLTQKAHVDSYTSLSPTLMPLVLAALKWLASVELTSTQAYNDSFVQATDNVHYGFARWLSAALAKIDTHADINELATTFSSGELVAMHKLLMTHGLTNVVLDSTPAVQQYILHGAPPPPSSPQYSTMSPSDVLSPFPPELPPFEMPAAPTSPNYSPSSPYGGGGGGGGLVDADMFAPTSPVMVEPAMDLDDNEPTYAPASPNYSHASPYDGNNEAIEAMSVPRQQSALDAAMAAAAAAPAAVASSMSLALVQDYWRTYLSTYLSADNGVAANYVRALCNPNLQNDNASASAALKAARVPFESIGINDSKTSELANGLNVLHVLVSLPIGSTSPFSPYIADYTKVLPRLLTHVTAIFSLEPNTRRTVLHTLAQFGGSLEMAQRLLIIKANLKSQEDAMGAAPYHLAFSAQAKHLEKLLQVE